MSEQRPTCQWCGEVIGSYEPIIVLVGGEAHETSLLAADAPVGDIYHAPCYGQAYAESA